MAECGQSSPDATCAICLGEREEQCCTDTCLHQFCFSCLVEWTKVKSSCPLCKRDFSAILYNIRADDDYDEYKINIQLAPPSQPGPLDSGDIELQSIWMWESDLAAYEDTYDEEEDTSDEEEFIWQVGRPPTPEIVTPSDSEE